MPAPPSNWSAPVPPERKSSPVPPLRMSRPSPPTSATLPRVKPEASIVLSPSPPVSEACSMPVRWLMIHWDSRASQACRRSSAVAPRSLALSTKSVSRVATTVSMPAPPKIVS